MAIRKTTRLNVEGLETREVPANINVTFAAGTYSLIGDDSDSEIVLSNVDGNLQVSSSTATFFLFKDTQYNTLTLPEANAVRMNLGGGNDNVKLAAANDFKFTKPLAIDLGEGTNSVDFTTTGKMELGAVQIKGGAGTDTIFVSGYPGKGSSVNGAFNVSLGAGDNVVQIDRMSFPNAAGIKVANGIGTSQTANFGTTDVAGPVSVKFGAETGNLGFADGDLHRINATANKSLAASFNFTDVLGDVTMNAETLETRIANTPTWNGNFSAKAKFENQLTIDGSVHFGDAQVHPNLNLAGNRTYMDVVPAAMSLTSGQFESTGDIRLNAVEFASLNLSNSSLEANNVSLKGGIGARLKSEGTLAPDQACKIANDLTLNAKQGGIVLDTYLEVGGNVRCNAGLAGLYMSNYAYLRVGKSLSFNSQEFASDVSAGSIDVGQNLTINATNKLNLKIVTNGVTYVGKDLNMRGGVGDDEATIFNILLVYGNANFNLGDGNNTIQLAPTNFPANVIGDLRIQTGKGTDLVLIKQLTVTGATSVRLGAGTDTFAMQASGFQKSFTLDSGAGNDYIQIAHLTMQPQPVAFFGPVKVSGGTGDDSLLLGKATGDGKSKVIFNGSSSFDGGTGNDTFDPTAASTAGLGTINW